MARGSEAISPTAHYTGYVWAKSGLSHPELETLRGRLAFEALRPSMMLIGAVGGPTLEDFLLTRHEALDALLVDAIESQGVTQVIEVACGLSPRGWRFAKRYGERITYVEADLPEMASLKREALERIGSLSDRHRVMEVDALSDEGPESLAALAEQLDSRQPTAIVTEGLIGYFPREQAVGMWRRFARVLAGFPAGRYLSDAYVREDMGGAHIEAGRAVLSAFVRGRVHLHFANASEAVAALAAAGFDDAAVRRAAEFPAAQTESRGPGAGLVRIIDARTKAS